MMRALLRWAFRQYLEFGTYATPFDLFRLCERGLVSDQPLPAAAGWTGFRVGERHVSLKHLPPVEFTEREFRLLLPDLAMMLFDLDALAPYAPSDAFLSDLRSQIAGTTHARMLEMQRQIDEQDLASGVAAAGW